MERGDTSNVTDIIRNSKVVLTTQKHRYHQYNDLILPVVQGENNKLYVKTILTDKMGIHTE